MLIPLATQNYSINYHHGISQVTPMCLQSSISFRKHQVFSIHHHDLNWKTHIEYIYNKLIKFVGIFYKLRNKLPSRILQSIYSAFIHLHLLYGNIMLIHTSYLHKHETLNNKLLRILQNKPHNSPSSNLYIDYNTLSIPDLHIISNFIVRS